jgi:hypothetical protein
MVITESSSPAATVVALTGRLDGTFSAGLQQKAHLFYLTSLFERSIWLLHQVGLGRQRLDPTAVPVRQS